MKKLVSGVMLVSMLAFGGSLVGAEATVTQGSVIVITGGGNAQPSGKGFTASSTAHQSQWGTNYQPISVTVDGTPVAQGDPPSVM